MFLSVLNEQAPLKTKLIKKGQISYMNSELGIVIHQRNMWRNKHCNTKEINLPGKIMLNGGTKWLNLKTEKFHPNVF